MISITNKILKWRLHRLTFPKLSRIKYNNLWEISHRTFRNLNLLEFIRVFKSLVIDNYSLNSLLTFSTIALIIKRSGILEEKDTESHLKMFKALNVETNNVNLFLKKLVFFYFRFYLSNRVCARFYLISIQ